jgi:beta-glucosidase
MLDNYEWLEGYRPKFGLVEVDRTIQSRKPKPTAYWLGEIARKNAAP